jgi:energy-converting hydrogenase Eha subunit E
MTIYYLLILIASALIMIILGKLAEYVGKGAAQPYVEMIDEISKMDIPLGEKIKLMNEVRK